jgi:hypothetical protein
MTKIILVLLIALVLYMMSRTKEKFGYSGYTKPVHTVILDDSSPDMSEYREDDNVSISNDQMEKFVLLSNKYVSEKTKLCTYIIETTLVKKFKHATKNHDLYQCMFMFMRQGGFSFGFSAVVDILVVSGNVEVRGARTQPLGVVPPTDTTPFESSIRGSEFKDFSTFEKGELDLIKNKSI